MNASLDILLTTKKRKKEKTSQANCHPIKFRLYGENELAEMYYYSIVAIVSVPLRVLRTSQYDDVECSKSIMSHVN